MTLNELLKANGVADDSIEKIVKEMKENKIFTVGEENLDIRYGKLKTDFDNLNAKHGEATALIEQLKASSKGNEDLNAKVNAYEQQIAQLNTQLEESKIEAAMDRALNKAGAKAEDFDYLKFQWRKKGEIKLDDNGEIKGGDDSIAAMKTQFSAQFTTEGGNMTVELNHLPKGNTSGTGVTQEQFNRMGYQSRLKLKQESPEAYAQLTGKNI